MGTIQIDGSTPKLTIGNATAEDATILFDGNAQDFYIALDDSADDLVIGLGSTIGTTPIISLTEGGAVTMKNIGTGDDNPMVLTLQTSEIDMAANDILGSIRFQAPDEGTGTDAILIAALGAVVPMYCIPLITTTSLINPPIRLSYQCSLPKGRFH